VNLSFDAEASLIINKFMRKYNLEAIKSNVSSNVNIVDFTYRHKTLGFQSYIDYFILDKKLICNVLDFNIIDCGSNLSDHNPVILEISRHILELNNRLNNKTDTPKISVQYTLRWDHANTYDFYNRTFIDSANVANMLNELYDDLMNCNINDFDPVGTESFFCPRLNKHIDVVKVIEDAYGTIVNILDKAANELIPSRKHNFYKYWWNEELNVLKNNSITSHKLWVENGNPRSGSIFESKNKARLVYKNCINQHKKEELSSVTNSLHDALICKNNATFWKMWKNKLGGKKPLATSINGLNDERSIANAFAEYFRGIDKVSNNKSEAFNKVFKDRLKTYAGDSVMNANIGVEQVESIIKHLDRGKAAGNDRLSCEHLLYCHPVIIVMLTKLFNLMLKFQYVPDAFGIGIIVPIPKSSTG